MARAIENTVNTKTHRAARPLVREMGMALAVLALYVLTLLLPLHQAAGLQRDLNAVGFSTLDTWSVCQSLAQDEHGEPHEAAALNCPATGIAKHQLAFVVPPALAFVMPQAAPTRPGLALALAGQPLLPDHFGQSRAPPVSV